MGLQTVSQAWRNITRQPVDVPTSADTRRDRNTQLSRMDLLRGVQLVNKSGRYVLANHALRDKKVILFYFATRSAAQDFAPYLREAYEGSRVEGGGGGVEVVLVSDVRPSLCSRD